MKPTEAQKFSLHGSPYGRRSRNAGIQAWRRPDGTAPNGTRAIKSVSVVEPGALVRWLVFVERTINGRPVAVRESYVGRVHAVDGSAITLVTCDEQPRLIVIDRAEVAG